jgi:3-dehydroquinate synthase
MVRRYLMRSVTVAAAAPYEVYIKPSLDLGRTVCTALAPGGTAALLTDSNVGPLYAPSVTEALEEAGWTVADVVEVPTGEGSKSLSIYEKVVRRLAVAGLSRGATLFVLGGGVVGDLGGFVASSYARGIDVVQLPTSLLAMVDSSIGGKVGLDLPEGKNLIGAFLQPRLVAANLDWLKTLPPHEISNGLAEVVKMGLLSGGGFFEDLARLLPDARTGDPDALLTLILHSVRAKALQTHENLVSVAGLPSRGPTVDLEAVLEAMRRDKKRRTSNPASDYRFVLLEEVGRPRWGVPVKESEARLAIEGVLGP